MSKRTTTITAESERNKLTIAILWDDKNQPGQNAGQMGSISNRIFEGLLEFFNANELKVVEFCKLTNSKPTAKKGAKK